MPSKTALWLELGDVAKPVVVVKLTTVPYVTRSTTVVPLDKPIESPVLFKFVVPTSKTKMPCAGRIPERESKSTSTGVLWGVLSSVNFHPVKLIGLLVVFSNSTHSLFPLDGLETNSLIIG